MPCNSIFFFVINDLINRFTRCWFKQNIWRSLKIIAFSSFWRKVKRSRPIIYAQGSSTWIVYYILLCNLCFLLFAMKHNIRIERMQWSSERQKRINQHTRARNKRVAQSCVYDVKGTRVVLKAVCQTLSRRDFPRR